MLKRVMAMVLAGMLLCSATAGAYAADIVETPVDQSVSQTAAKPDLGIMPLSISYGQEIYSSSGAYVTDDYTATKNKGKIIRVYYKNEEDTGAYVVLWKKGLLGGFSDVMHFTINPNKQGFKEYSASSSDSGTYHVRVTPTNGNIVDGYLAFVQTSTSMNS